MNKFLHTITYGNVEDNFYKKNISQLREHNIKMLKIAFTCGMVVNIILFCFALSTEFLHDLMFFYGFFSAWFVFWEIMTFKFLVKNHHFAKFFYAILAASVLAISAFAGTLYSPNMLAVTHFIFLIFIPSLYVDKPKCCITTTILSGVIFCGMVLYFKTDPYIIQVDIINTVFSVVVGIVYNLYSINLQIENIQASVILKEQSTTDELTLMPNRRSFNKLIEGYFEDCKDSEISIIMMDVDHFKLYNDTYGHLKGDECLARIGKAMIETAKEFGVFVARYGGEEFIAVNFTHSSIMTKTIAEAFVKSIANLGIDNTDSSYHQVTLSAGYASYPECEVKNYMQLINCADEALYEAKRKGRNQACKHNIIKSIL